MVENRFIDWIDLTKIWLFVTFGITIVSLTIFFFIDRLEKYRNRRDLRLFSTLRPDRILIINQNFEDDDFEEEVVFATPDEWIITYKKKRRQIYHNWQKEGF